MRSEPTVVIDLDLKWSRTRPGFVKVDALRAAEMLNDPDFVQIKRITENKLDAISRRCCHVKVSLVKRDRPRWRLSIISSNCSPLQNKTILLSVWNSIKDDHGLMAIFIQNHKASENVVLHESQSTNHHTEAQ